MNILIVYDGIIPAKAYGGVERVIWFLAKALFKLGHNISFLVPKGSHCPFANIIELDMNQSIETQIPTDIDIVHINIPFKEQLSKPFIITLHGNAKTGEALHPNTVFISKNHAERHNGSCFIYNGLDWGDYPEPSNLYCSRHNFHFLAKAAWRLKNVKGAIKTTLKIPAETLHVLGGNRLNFKMGFRLTLSQRVRFHGMVGGLEKFQILNQSKGLVFPVLWDEPFGLAIIESLYFGAPVFGTPYGSLPELVTEEIGHLSTSSDSLSEAMQHAKYSSKSCYEYANDNFNSDRMARDYLDVYEKVLNNHSLNINSNLGLTKLHQDNKFIFN